MDTSFCKGGTVRRCNFDLIPLYCLPMAIALQFEKRDPKVAPNTLRNAGKIPAVFYGRKQESTPITLSARDFEKVWKKAGENTIVNLTSGGEEVQALIHEVEKH